MRMLNNKNIILLLVAIIAFASCSKEKQYQITGTVEDGDGVMVYLKKVVDKDESIIEDSVEVIDGKFVLNGTLENIDKRVLEVGKGKTSILLDNTPINITVNYALNKEGNKTEVYDIQVEGSEEQKVLKDGEGLLMGKSLMDFARLLALSQAADNPAKLDSVRQETTEMQNKIKQNIEQYLDTNVNRMATTYIIADLITSGHPFEKIEQHYNQLTSSVKESYPGKLLHDKVEKLKKVNMGGEAPDIELTNLDGDKVALSSLRGKYVLLDFWASWCGPCIAELPNVKKVYEKYKDKGFEIYGVSLDDSREAWETAVEKNEMTWINVSSIKGWECPSAREYNITAIPQMYLLDKEGRIVGVNLRGEALQNKLAKLMEG